MFSSSSNKLNDSPLSLSSNPTPAPSLFASAPPSANPNDSPAPSLFSSASAFGASPSSENECNCTREMQQHKKTSTIASETNAKTDREKEKCNISSKTERNKVTSGANQDANLSSMIMISSILKGMPQCPHFYQLRNCSELTRKSIIASWNSIFKETVEQIQSLQANNFGVKANELWKTLEELHTIGYNVVPLRRRLVELSDVVTEQKLCKLKIKRLKNKAENHRAEKSRLEFVILKLQEMIRKEEEDMS